MLCLRIASRSAAILALALAASLFGSTFSFAGGYETSHAAVTDGAGGMIVAWEDSRAGERNIYAQRLSAAGTRMWADTGVVICNAPGDQIVPGIASDGSHGAIVIWRDYRNGNADIYAQRVSGAGVTQWTGGGVGVCTLPSPSGPASIVADGAGGALIAWADSRSGSLDVWAQHLDASGTPLWAADGVGICTESGSQYGQQMVPDGAGGAVLAWTDGRSGFDVFAQRVNAAGVVQWTTAGVPMALTPLYSDAAVSVAADGAGGAFVSWFGDRCCPDTFRVFLQHVNGAGAVQWGPGGVAAAPLPDYEEYPHVVADDAGGAIVVWHDYDRSLTRAAPIAQRLDGTGAQLWGPAGVVLSAVGSETITPAAIPDGAGGAFAVWEDFRNASSATDLHAQRVGADGSLAWGTSGVPVCTAAGNQRDPAIVPDGAGGAIAVWDDFRDTASLPDSSIFAQRLDGAGTPQWTLDGVRVYLTAADLAGIGPGPARLALAVGPNPAHQSITVSFSLADSRPATLEVLDVTGRRIAAHALEGLSAGPHLLRLEPGTRGPGLFFVRLTQGPGRIVRRISVLN